MYSQTIVKAQNVIRKKNWDIKLHGIGQSFWEGGSTNIIMLSKVMFTFHNGIKALVCILHQHKIITNVHKCKTLLFAMLSIHLRLCVMTLMGQWTLKMWLIISLTQPTSFYNLQSPLHVNLNLGLLCLHVHYFMLFLRFCLFFPNTP